jgi:hypothetical protein
MNDLILIHITTLGYIAWNSGMKWARPILRNYHSIFLKGLEETRNPSVGTGRDLNQGPPEYNKGRSILRRENYIIKYL